MNETIRSAIFVAVAAVAALVTWGSWKATKVPEFAEPGRIAMEGKPLFPKFTDPWAATSLEIVKYDAQTAAPVPFKVAQIEGKWSIPSHSNYPTDAKDQLAEAAASMIGLEVVDMASDDPDTHAMYGVIDPTAKPADTPAEDVGVRVVMRDKEDKVLLGLVVGREVPDRDELRYVRLLDENPVYTVAVKTDKLSNKFEDWIEEDLLKLSSWDIKEIEIQDYSMVERGGRYGMRPGAQMTLKYDDTGDPKWSLAKDLVFSEQERKPVPGKMADDEELDTEKLNAMKTSLDDLKIVDVRRKPSGLSSDLRAAGTLMNDLETVLSLQSKGYYLVEVPVQDKVYLDVLSNQGELRVSMKDGVQYVLRFGEIASGTAQGSDEKKEEEGKAEEEGGEETDDSKTAGLNRYLFVMAQFDPDMIPKPELEPLPGEGPQATQDQPAAEAQKPEEAKPEATKAEEAKPEAADASGGDGDGADEEPPKADQPQPSEPKPEDAPAEKPESGEAKTEGEKQETGEDALKAERERIEKENKRKQEEYDEKVKEGKEHVEELNERFADWYYVISNDVYKEIHLTRSDIIKKKEKEEKTDEEGEEADQKEAADEPKDAEAAEAPAEKPKEEGHAVSDFEKLKEEGVEGAKP